MKHKYKSLAAAAMLLYLFAGTGLHAQQAQPGSSNAQSAPRTLSYQGVLLNTGSGTKAAGSRLLTVTLYSDANGTNKLWQSAMNTLADSNGVFNCTLGTAENPLPAPSAMDRPIWLGVAIDNGPELRPLSQVTASAYALNVVDNAITTAKLADNSVTTAKIADSSITPSKLNLDYISSININGVQFTGHGTPLNIQGENGITAAYKADSNTLVLYGPNSNAKAGQAIGGGVNTTNDPCGTNSDGTPGANAGLNTVSGGCNNEAIATLGYATIGGGQNNEATQKDATVGGGDTNLAIGQYSTVSGGIFNQASGEWSFVGGGDTNISSGASSSIGGGFYNAATSEGATIGGGDSNIVYNSVGIPQSSFGTIGGGESNLVAGEWGTVGGGNHNISGENSVNDDSLAVVAGGSNNWAREEHSAIVGGQNNQAMGTFGFIGGGAKNLIDDDSHFITQYSTIDGGLQNAERSAYDAIIGGDSNLIQSGSNYGVIGGGAANLVDTTSPYSSILGGDTNRIAGTEDVVAGGHGNSVGIFPPYVPLGAGVVMVPSNYSAIGGGKYNFISGSDGSVIAGGIMNEIGVYSNPSGNSVIAGGDSNQLDLAPNGVIGGGGKNILQQTSYATIGGGYNNQFTNHTDEGTIAGGEQNTVSNLAKFGSIGGGDSNTITGGTSGRGNYGTIGGGERNYVSSHHGTISGGDSNYLNTGLGSVGGGYFNRVGVYNLVDSFSVIAGGYQNQAQQNGAAITGGLQNQAIGVEAFVGGGFYNLSLADYATTAGGYANSILSTYSTIAGGAHNMIDDSSYYGTIAGGYQNVIDTNVEYATIGGGNDNQIVGLDTGHVDQAPTIAGGANNVINKPSDYASIGGGRYNHILSAGMYACIPGGDSLSTNSFAQTVTGYNNIISGTFVEGTGHKYGSNSLTTQDLPLFIVGNGDVSGILGRSDAATVSYDGHISAYDVNGSGGASTPLTPRSSFVGTTYEDNNIYAWADVPMAIVNGPVTANADFGVQSINRTAPGQYLVVLNIAKPDGSGPYTMIAGSVVVTVEASSQSSCDFATCSQIAGNTFTIWLHDTGCNHPDVPFMFHVCGR